MPACYAVPCMLCCRYVCTLTLAALHCDGHLVAGVEGALERGAGGEGAARSEHTGFVTTAAAVGAAQRSAACQSVVREGGRAQGGSMQG